MRPKPMVEIGGMPILSHIMRIYEAHGAADFFLALSYKAEIIKKFFVNYGNLDPPVVPDVRNTTYR